MAEAKRPRRLTRRQFIRLTALAGAGITAAACGRGRAREATALPAPAGAVSQAPAPTQAPTTAAAAPGATPTPAAPTLTPQPTAGLPGATATSLPAATATSQPTATSTTPPATATPAPTLTPVPAAPVGPAEVIKVYPAGPSPIVRASHTGVWSGDRREPAALREILDASITRLTGIDDAKAAWAALFKPTERIALKINTIAGSRVWTNVPMVEAVAASLVAAGIPAEQIVVYDRAGYELQNAGFKLNKDGPGVRVVATENDYAGSYKVGGQGERLSQVLLGCDALINMPVLKQHSMSGLSFAMKNHYGTVNSPGSLHATSVLNLALGELSMLPEIRKRTRLIIGDCTLYTATDSWSRASKSDTVIMSFDTVAADWMALQKLVELKKAANENPAAQVGRATAWLQNAAKMGLGTDDEKNMKIMEVKLG